MADPNSMFPKGWAQVPRKLLLLLVQRIAGLPTLIRFGAVCRYWHWLALTSKCNYKPVPWLMLSESFNSNFIRFYDLCTHEIYQLSLPQARGKKILGCNFGWLITIGKDGEFHLLNPLTSIELPLPSMSTFQSAKESILSCTQSRIRDLFALKATLSSNPSSSSDVVVMVVNLGYDTTCLSFCRPSDGQWGNFQKVRQRQLDYVGEKFFAITWSGSIYACEIDSNAKPRMVKVAKFPQPHIYPLSCYTVECGGELLFIVVTRQRTKTSRMHPDKGIYAYESSFKVYKLNSEKRRLVEVRSIGDYALFLGNNNAICLPATSGIKAYRRNTIYFSPDGDDQCRLEWAKGGGFDFGVFSLDDGSINQLNYLNASKAKYSLSTWIIPNCN